MPQTHPPGSLREVVVMLCGNCVYLRKGVKKKTVLETAVPVRKYKYLCMSGGWQV